MWGLRGNTLFGHVFPDYLEDRGCGHPIPEGTLIKESRLQKRVPQWFNAENF